MTLAECMGPSLLLNLKVSFQRLKFKVPMYWTYLGWEILGKKIEPWAEWAVTPPQDGWL